MPFLLCFSYRLYYQYIFIYFSASSSDKENSSIIFLITSSVNNSPFSFFSCRRCRCRFQTAKQCRFHQTYIFHTLKKHRKTNCCANNNNNCNDDPGWKLQICRENPRPGQEKNTLPPINIPHPVIVRFPLESPLNLSMFHRIIFSRIASKSLTKCTGKTAWITESHHFCDLCHRILSTLHQRKAFVDTVFFQISGDSFACHFFEKAAADFS